MEMQIDSSLIRSEREKRAWSQEHLAKLTGLGLRTIQRIEATGAASYESAGALASVLSIPLADLRVTVPITRSLIRPSNWQRKATAIGAACAACAFSVLAVRTTLAEEVTLDVGISWNDENERAVGVISERAIQVLTEEGEDAEICIDDVLRVIIVPTIRDDGSILLSAKIFEFDEGEPRLLSEPRVATLADTAAKIEQGSDSGNVYSLVITPHLQ